MRLSSSGWESFPFAKKAWICSLTSVLTPFLISTSSPCTKIDVFLQSSDLKKKSPLLWDCSPFSLIAYWFSALETCSFLSQVLLVIPGLWYLLVDTPALRSMKTGHNVNMPMFYLKQSLLQWWWELSGHGFQCDEKHNPMWQHNEWFTHFTHEQ